MPSQHLVQFYGANRNALVNTLCRYATDGLDAGESVVIISSRTLHDAVLKALDGADDGRLHLIESEAMLERLMLDGRLSAKRFDQIVGDLLRDVVARSRTRQVRAFGDMVDILWRRGHHAEALELERYWSDLQQHLPFELYCAYDVDVLSEEFQAESIAPVLAEHSKVLPSGRAELTGALDYAAYETLGRRCPPLPNAEATVLWLRTHAPDHASEILERARQYTNG
jgi:hypothetical protein